LSVALGDLIHAVRREIDLEELAGKVVAIDAYNAIYQFLSIIRQPDGTPLSDSNGNVTRHLSGIFYRTSNLLNKGIVPIFVFDGLPPVQKQRVLAARAKRREDALAGWDAAKKKGMTEEARTYAMASTRINEKIVKESKELLSYMGVGCIQAPSEGEAQGAYLAKANLVYASASQDYDSFLFGASTVIRNLTISGKRKLPGRNSYINVSTEQISLNDLIRNLGIRYEQLIWLGILIGTDFNQGIRGVGPKTALKIVRGCSAVGDVTNLIEKKYGKPEFEFEETERIFTDPEIRQMDAGEIDTVINSAKPDKERILRFLCDEHNFSRERIGKFADNIVSARGKSAQKGIEKWMV